jgi:hypothetical protein
MENNTFLMMTAFLFLYLFEFLSCRGASSDHQQESALQVKNLFLNDSDGKS